MTTFAKVIVGVDDSQGARDAIALANALGDELVLVNAYLYDATPRNAALAGDTVAMRAEALELLERQRAATGVQARVRAMDNDSPAGALPTSTFNVDGSIAPGGRA